jgi:hypothetical protein
VIPNHEQWLQVLSVSWPRPAAIQDDRWIGTPDWDTPLMPWLPSWRFEALDGVGCHALDWSDGFRMDLNRYGQPNAAEMRGFYVVFRLRVQHSGRLVFFASDGCIIRRNGEVVHEDRRRHGVDRHELGVGIGDRLEIAQWQSSGRWIWAARWEPSPVTGDQLACAEAHRHRVEDALTRPNGPMLKVFTDAADPLRCVLSIYSLVLNGYRPAGIQIFGEQQWPERSAHVMRTLLPFADIVSLSRLERTLDALNPGLVPLTKRLWGAMKLCIGLFFPPYTYCYMDDDIIVLDRMDDALQLLDRHTLVSASDNEPVFRYTALQYPVRPEWPERPVPRNLSTGFYLIKNDGDLVAQSERAVNTPTDNHQSWIWEQGFFAWEFARASTAVLPHQRYFVPLFDGLPGGIHGYDWYGNPCQFAWVHFGAMFEAKPGDDEAALWFQDVLRR